MARKTLWATSEIHKTHENALDFVQYLVKVASASGNNSIKTLENMLRKAHERVVEAELELDKKAGWRDIDNLSDDLNAMRMFTWKATGGKFDFEKRIADARKMLGEVHDLGCASKYVAQHIIMKETQQAPSVSAAASAGGGATGGGGTGGVASGKGSTPGAKVMCETDYFLLNFKDLLGKLYAPDAKSKIMPNVIDKFKDFLAEHTELPPTSWALVEKEPGWEECGDCVLITFRSGTKVIEMVERVGDTDTIYDKYETLRKVEHLMIYG